MRSLLLGSASALVLIILAAASTGWPAAQVAGQDRMAPLPELEASHAPRAGPEWLTRPERTDFRETSSYEEVVDWLERAAAGHPRLHLTTFGYTNEGRALPLLVTGPVADGTAEAVRGAAVPVVYLQGNIHGGEVAGKEALLRIVRRLHHGELDDWLRDVVLLIGPIYNADGNERVDLRNRPRQHGPLGGMGTRANAQGLDLNRDQMKLDSPEARSLARLLTEYDPQVLVDLHTTNGTRHGYHLTYSPPLHPATPESVDRLLREGLLPAVTRRVEAEHGWHFWHYGNVSVRGGTRGWYTFDHRPRFVTNYAGLRNRIGILSEAYSYATFEDRILASERFTDEIVDWVRGHADEVRRLVREEDERDLRGTALPLRAAFPDDGEPARILMGDVAEEVNPWSGQTILRRTDTLFPEEIPGFIGFRGTESETVPEAYLVPAQLTPALERLRAHGIRLEPASLDGSTPAVSLSGEGGTIQAFRVIEIDQAENPFQGRREVRLAGSWEEAAAGVAEGFTEGAYLVQMRQPLARLAVLLLEPRADDGLANWGVLEPWLEEGEVYPILRIVSGPGAGPEAEAAGLAASGPAASNLTAVGPVPGAAASNLAAGGPGPTSVAPRPARPFGPPGGRQR